MPSRDCRPKHTITLTNITKDETICYSLPIIKGYISTLTEEPGHQEPRTILLRKLQNNIEPEEVTTWPVINSNFKCLPNLDLGKNHLVLEFEDCHLKLNLEFKPKKTDYHVLPVYIVCDGHDGKFQAPEHENNSPESACRRIFLGSKLIQTFTAEKLFENNMGRKTFQLASDLNLGMNCVLFHSVLTPEEVYSMKSEEIWEHFGRELMSSSYGSDKRKFLAFLSCTKYIPSDKEPQTHEEMVAQMQGHVALGGGGLAIFGTGCLHTWPETIEQILPKFLDETKVDKSQFMDDSCYRGTYGSCFSTTLGSVCHELGHAFDLGHSKTGIMGRGFDNISLVFTVGSHSRDVNKNVVPQREGQHTTVCFTRNLNIIYSASSPIRRPRRQFFRTRSNSPQKIAPVASYTINKNMNSTLRSHEVLNDNDKKRTSSKILADDLTFWDRSCSTLLNYHRWFIESASEKPVSSIEYDKFRNQIISSAGIRVVELRGDNGLVLASWEFLSSHLTKQFTPPIQNFNTKCAKMIVAEDSVQVSGFVFLDMDPNTAFTLHSWNSSVSGGAIENEEWLAFLQRNMEELMTGQLDCLRNTNLVSVIVAPLRNSNASAKVLEFVANMLSLPFVINGPTEKEIENIEEVYLEVRVIPNLIYASKIIARCKCYDGKSNASTDPSETETSLQPVSELSADELQALEAIYLLICYLVHCNEDFLIQFCDAVAILNVISFMQQFLTLGRRKLRVVTDLLAILNLILQELPENANLVEQILLGPSSEGETAVDLSKLLTHPSCIVRLRTCELLKLLSCSKQSSVQAALSPKLEQDLNVMLSDSSASLRMAAEEVLDILKKFSKEN